nr:MAG TPA: hypothetical protein [Caudoviricetes sp.]
MQNMDKNIIFIRFLHILKVAKYGRVAKYELSIVCKNRNMDKV